MSELPEGVEQYVAKVTGTMLGYEDHGILTAFLYLDYGRGGGNQGAGGLCLAEEYTDSFIRGVLKACGVRQWEDLKGRTIYAWADYGRVYKIGPLPTEPGEDLDIYAFSNQEKNTA